MIFLFGSQSDLQEQITNTFILFLLINTWMLIDKIVHFSLTYFFLQKSWPCQSSVSVQLWRV